MMRFCDKCDRLVEAIEQLYEVVCSTCGQPLQDGVEPLADDTDLEDDE